MLKNLIPKGGSMGFWAPAKKRELSELQPLLIDTLAGLQEALAKQFDAMSFDLETNSLNPETGDIVGFSFSFEEKAGYYVPLRHLSGGNIENPEAALKMAHGRMLLCKTVYFYNARFDMRFLEYKGFHCAALKYFDVPVLVHLSDSNEKNVSLKAATKHYLGYEPPTYEAVVQGASTFDCLYVDEAYKYAAYDAIGTFMLAKRLGKMLLDECAFIVKLDNKILYPLMKFEETPIKLDIQYLQDMRSQLETKIEDLYQMVCMEYGERFNPGSPVQVAKVLLALGLSTGKYTDKGAMSTRADDLEQIDHPIVKKIVEHRQLTKMLGTYVKTLLEHRAQGFFRARYITSYVPTGRLAASGGGASAKKKNDDMFARLNIQAITKSQPAAWYAKKDDAPDSILGWSFSQDPSFSSLQVSGFDPALNLRKAIIAPDDHVLIHFDYKGEEVRIAANYSKEPVLLDAFLHGDGDVHTAVAKVAKVSRQEAKTINFAVLYGANAYTIAKNMKSTEEEAQKIIDSLKSSQKVLYAWQSALQKKGKREGVVHNYFGRPRRVEEYFRSGDTRQAAFGYRTIVNTVIQSIGGDIIKMAICKLYKKMKDYPAGDIRFVSVVHDEMNITVKKSILVDMLDWLNEEMTMTFPGWPIPFEVEISLGYSWGEIFTFVKADGVWRPEYKESKGQEAADGQVGTG